MTHADADPAPVSSTPPQETFTPEQIRDAIRQWLLYGEDSFVPKKAFGAPGHAGVFSGCGWAARVLRFHLQSMEIAALASPVPPNQDTIACLERRIAELCEAHEAQHIRADRAEALLEASPVPPGWQPIIQQCVAELEMAKALLHECATDPEAWINGVIMRLKDALPLPPVSPEAT